MLWGQPQYLPLLGFALLPLLVHLLARRQRRLVLFSMTRFLQEVAYQTQGRRWLRELLLLLLRTGAAFFALLALVRPYAPLQLPLPPAPTAIVLVVDNSLSMQSRDLKTRRQWFEQAKRWCQQAVKGLHADVALLTAERVSKPLCSFTASPSQRLRAVQQMQPTFKALDLLAALQAADDLLTTQTAAVKRIVVITDLQSEPFRSLRLPSLRHPVTVVDVKPSESMGNGRLTARLRFPLDPATNVDIVAELQNLSPQGLQGELRLLVAGKEVQRIPVSIAPSGKILRTLTLPIWVMQAADEQGRVQVEVHWRSPADALPWDDRVVFTFRAPSRLKVVNALDTGRSFVDAALRAVGIVPLRSAPNADVILSSAPATQEAAQALVQQWQQGCGVVVFADRLNSPLWKALNLSVQPHPNRRSLAVQWVDENHPLLTSLGAALRTVVMQPVVTVASDSARVLASFDDGSPLLLELKNEGQRFFIMSVALDTPRNSALVQSSVFIPLLHRLVRVAAYGTERHLQEAEEPPQGSERRSTVVPQSESDFRLPDAAKVAQVLRASGGDLLTIAHPPSALLAQTPLRDMTSFCLLVAVLCLLVESALTFFWWRRAR